MNKVFLVTKLNTTNLGNQALSMELIRLFEMHIGKENLFVGGRPLNFYGYNMNDLKKASDPTKLFEEWADAVVNKYRSVSVGSEFTPGIDPFILTRVSDNKMEGMKALLRPLKRFLKRSFLFDKSYVERLDKINSSDVFVYSGAGEVSDNHVFLRQMLEIRIAQKLGKRTGAVNQSLVIKTNNFKKIVGLVYGAMDHIVVRGEVSKAAIAATGVSEKKIFVAPDSAVCTDCDISQVPKNNMVGINLTPFIKFHYHDVEKVLAKLKTYNRKVVFITNEPIGDIPVIQKFKDDYKINCLPECDDYISFTKKIAAFEYIIGARLHTSVLALTVGVPVVPIEGLVWKTKELFSQLKYPIDTVNVDDRGWAESIIQSIDLIEKKQIDFKHYFSDILPRYKLEANRNVTWINDTDQTSAVNQ